MRTKVPILKIQINIPEQQNLKEIKTELIFSQDSINYSQVGNIPSTTISDGDTVIIDGAAICNALYVGQGIAGLLRFGATAITLTTVQGVSVAGGGIFDTGAPGGTDLTHTLNIGGSNATAMGTGSGSATTGFLYDHTAGTIKIGGNFTAANAVYNSSTTSYTIPAKGALWLNNPYFTISGQNGSHTNYGLVKLSTGNYNIGTESGNSMGAGTWAVFLIENGTMNVSGRLSSGNTYIYKQTGGTVNVTTVGNALTSAPGFGITSANSVFTMSGGTICVVTIIAPNTLTLTGTASSK